MYCSQLFSTLAPPKILRLGNKKKYNFFCIALDFSYLCTMKRTLVINWLLLICVMSAYAQWTRMTNLPTVYIDTYGGRPITNKTEYVYATMRYVDEQDQLTVYDSPRCATSMSKTS